MDASVPDKPYIHENDRRNDTSEADMVQAGRKGSKHEMGNNAMGVMVVQEDEGRLKRVTPFANETLAFFKGETELHW